MRTFSRLVVALTGLLFIVSGVLLILRPRILWEWGSTYAVWPVGQPVPTSFYILAVASLVLGLILLYAGLRRFVIYSTFVIIIGLIMLLAAIGMLIFPATFRDFENAIFYGRSDAQRLIFSYVGGIIRVIIGLVLFIAGIGRRRSDI